MSYLSKGKLYRKTKQAITVSHCGVLHKLTGAQAALWLIGQYAPGYTHNAKDEAELELLAGLGIAECRGSEEPVTLFRLLTNCVICPVKKYVFTARWHPDERRLWKWLTKAGLRLTMAELTLLSERGLEPVSSLLGEQNRQVLTEAIYTTDTISDGILETIMEKSPARDDTVQTVLSLLRKKKIMLL